MESDDLLPEEACPDGTLPDAPHSLSFTVEKEDAGGRIDCFAAEKAGISRSAAQKLLGEGRISIDGRVCAKRTLLRAGDCVEITVPPPTIAEALPEDLPISILYEDEDLAIVEKPKGMVVHPAPGNPDGTLVNALLYHLRGRLSGIGGVLRPGIVHRIDKDTSGILIVAKNDAAHLALQAQIKVHSFERIYHAILVGNLREDEGTVDAPIGRHSLDRKRMAIRQDGRRAVTHYRVLERFPGFCYVKLRLETGRTHQIRVHMASLGHPVAGDTVYGGGKTAFEEKHRALFAGQCLHAKYIAFRHPRDGRLMEFDSPLPPYFTKLLTLLRATEEN